MAIAFDHELLADLDRARFGHAADIVATQIDQHHVLGAFLRVGQQFGFQCLVQFGRGAARAGAGDRAHSDHAIAQARQNFWRRTNHLGTADIEKIHVRRRIQCTQRAIHIHRARAERHAQALRWHYLEDIAGTHVFLRLAHHGVIFLAGKRGMEVRFVDRIGNLRLRVTGAALTQAMRQLVQAPIGAHIGLRLPRVGMHDQVQTALEIVEHRQLFGEHQQDVRRAEFVGLVATPQARLDVLDALETEPADQPAGEAGQPIQLRHRMFGPQRIDFGQRVGDLTGLDDFAVFADLQRVAPKAVHAPRRQADDGVAPEALPAFDRFEQIGIGAVGELQVDRERRVQVGQHFADNGNTGVTFSGLALELLCSDQDDFPSGTLWRGGRRQRATIATSGERKRRSVESSGGTRGYCSATAGPGQQAWANAVQQRRR